MDNIPNPFYLSFFFGFLGAAASLLAYPNTNIRNCAICVGTGLSIALWSVAIMIYSFSYVSMAFAGIGLTLFLGGLFAVKPIEEKEPLMDS